MPGDYNITVEKAGFHRFTENGVKLDVQQSSAIDVTIAVGDVSATVAVEGEAPPISTSASSIATIIENKRSFDLR